MILKKFGNEKVHLVDYFGKLTFEVLKSIIEFGINFSIEMDSQEFSFWHNKYLENLELEKIYDEFNLIRQESNSYFGIKLLNSDESISNIQKWFLTMSDSDVY